jgi:hypothetical protein
MADEIVTQENQESTPQLFGAPPKPKKSCALPGCGTLFTPTDSKHKYCSDKCRAKASSMRRSPLGEAAAPGSVVQAQAISVKSLPPSLQKSDIAIPSNGEISASAMFIIDNLKEQRNDWKTEYSELRKKFEDLQREKESIDKQFDSYKRDKEIETVKNEKPAGLKGFMDSGVLQQLLPFVGPALGELSMAVARKAAQANSQPMIDNGNGEAGSEVVVQQGVTGVSAFDTFMQKLTPDTQQDMWHLINYFDQLGDSEAVTYMIKLILQRAANGR